MRRRRLCARHEPAQRRCEQPRCHPAPAKTKLKGLLEHQQLNAYTIEKTLTDGSKVKKLIYQTPWWKEDGSFGGLIEYSIEIPFEMPHFVRQPKPQQ